MSRRDSLLAALVATIWGFNFVVIDWGMDGVPPLVFVAVRFAAVVLPAIFLVRAPSAPWRTVAAVGVFMSLGQFGFLYVAMDAGLTPGLAALVLQAQVIFTIVIAAGVLRERPTQAQIVGVAVGSLGLVVVALGRGGNVTGVALALCLLAALSWGIGNVVSRSAGVVGGLSMTVWSAVVVPVPVLALSLLRRRPARRGGRVRGVRLAGGAVDALHRRARLARRVRRVQLAPRPQRVGVRRPMGAARPGRGDGFGVAAPGPACRVQGRPSGERSWWWACSWPCAVVRLRLDPVAEPAPVGATAAP